MLETAYLLTPSAPGQLHIFKLLTNWYPVWDSNPCTHRERVLTETARLTGHKNKRHFPILEGFEPSQKNLQFSFFNLNWTAVSLLLNKHYGAEDGAWTRNSLLGRQELYQLSYFCRKDIGGAVPALFHPQYLGQPIRFYYGIFYFYIYYIIFFKYYQIFFKWWSQSGSNRRPPRCKHGALPAELWPHGAARGIRTPKWLITSQLPYRWGSAAYEYAQCVSSAPLTLGQWAIN